MRGLHSSTLVKKLVRGRPGNRRLFKENKAPRICGFGEVLLVRASERTNRKKFPLARTCPHPVIGGRFWKFFDDSTVLPGLGHISADKLTVTNRWY